MKTKNFEHREGNSQCVCNDCLAARKKAFEQMIWDERAKSRSIFDLVLGR